MAQLDRITYLLSVTLRDLERVGDATTSAGRAIAELKESRSNTAPIEAHSK
jgi:hypothetical protein